MVVSTRKSSWVRLRTPWRWPIPVRTAPMATGVAQIDQTQASSKLLPTRSTTSRSWGSRCVATMRKNSFKCSNISSRSSNANSTNNRRCESLKAILCRKVMTSIRAGDTACLTRYSHRRDNNSSTSPISRTNSTCPLLSPCSSHSSISNRRHRCKSIQI